MTSDLFKVRVRHYNSKKERTVTFKDGALKISQSQAKPFKGHSGVKIEFTLVRKFIKTMLLMKILLRKRIIDLAYNNPGLTFYFNKEKYLFKKGLLELAERIDEAHSQDIGSDAFLFTKQKIRKIKRLKEKSTPAFL